MTTQNTEDTAKTTKKPRAKKAETTPKTPTETSNNTRKTVTLTESESTELKALADTLHLTESELIKIAIKAIANNAKKIVEAQEKTAYSPEMIVTKGIEKYCNQLTGQKNVGSKNSEIAENYELLVGIRNDCLKNGKKLPFRSIASKLAVSAKTNYNTVLVWLEANHPDELKD